MRDRVLFGIIHLQLCKKVLNYEVIDLDSFQGDELVNTLLKSDKKYLKDALVISNTKIDGYKCVKYENLNTALNLKKNRYN